MATSQPRAPRGSRPGRAGRGRRASGGHIRVRGGPGSARRGSAAAPGRRRPLRPPPPGARATRPAPAPSRSCARCRSRSAGRVVLRRLLLLVRSCQRSEIVPLMPRSLNASAASTSSGTAASVPSASMPSVRRVRSGSGRSRARRWISSPRRRAARDITSRIRPNSSPRPFGRASATRSSVSALWPNAQTVTSAGAGSGGQQHGQRAQPQRHDREPERDPDERRQDAAAREAQQHRHDQQPEQRMRERRRAAPARRGCRATGRRERPSPPSRRPRSSSRTARAGERRSRPRPAIRARPSSRARRGRRSRAQRTPHRTACQRRGPRRTAAIPAAKAADVGERAVGLHPGVGRVERPQDRQRGEAGQRRQRRERGAAVQRASTANTTSRRPAGRPRRS